MMQSLHIKLPWSFSLSNHCIEIILKLYSKLYSNCTTGNQLWDVIHLMHTGKKVHLLNGKMGENNTQVTVRINSSDANSLKIIPLQPQPAGVRLRLFDKDIRAVG